MARTLNDIPINIKPFNLIWKNWLNDISNLLGYLLADRYDHVTIQNANFGKGITAPMQVIVGNYTGWAFSINDDSVFNVELGHDVDDTKDLEIHITFAVNEAYATNSGEVQFQIDYSVDSHAGGNINTPASSGTLTTGDINIPTNAYDTHHETSLVIPASAYSGGNIIGCTLTRIAINDGNNPTAEPIILTFHIEYTRKATDWYGSV